LPFSAGAGDLLDAAGSAVSSGFDCRDSAGFRGSDFDTAFSFDGSVFGFGGAAGVTVIASERRYTVRRVKLDLHPRTFGPDEVKGIRAMIGVSQPLFGQFLGVDVKTVRSWEQGRRTPSGMACRFLEEIQASPEHWRSRLSAVLGTSHRSR
jgi:putative transcriptional regulator